MISKSISKAFSVLVHHPGYFIKFSLPLLALGYVFANAQIWLVQGPTAEKVFAVIGLEIVHLLIAAFFLLGVYDLVTKGEVAPDLFGRGLKRSLLFVLVSIFYFLFTFLGILFFVIPGILIGLAFFFAPYFPLFGLDQKDKSPMKQSRELVSGRMGSLALIAVPLGFMKVAVEILGSAGDPGVITMPLLSRFLGTFLEIGFSVLYVQLFVDFRSES